MCMHVHVHFYIRRNEDKPQSYNRCIYSVLETSYCEMLHSVVIRHTCVHKHQLPITSRQQHRHMHHNHIRHAEFTTLQRPNLYSQLGLFRAILALFRTRHIYSHITLAANVLEKRDLHQWIQENNLHILLYLPAKMGGQHQHKLTFRIAPVPGLFHATRGYSVPGYTVNYMENGGNLRYYADYRVWQLRTTSQLTHVAAVQHGLHG